MRRVTREQERQQRIIKFKRLVAEDIALGGNGHNVKSLLTPAVSASVANGSCIVCGEPMTDYTPAYDHWNEKTLENVEIHRRVKSAGQTKEKSSQVAASPPQRNNDLPQMLPIGSFRPHPQNPRLYLRDGIIASITKQVQEHGFLMRYALIVRPLPDDIFQIISGHHRYASGIRAGLNFLPAWITPMDDEQAWLELVLSNTQSELSLLEIAVFVARRLEGKDIKGEDDESITELAKRLKKSRQRLYQLAKAGQVFLHYKEVSNQFDTSHIHMLEGKVKHLTAINVNRTPVEHWNGLVQLILTRPKMTTDEVSKAVMACRQMDFFDVNAYAGKLQERPKEPTTLYEYLQKLSRQKLVELSLYLAEHQGLTLHRVKELLFPRINNPGEAVSVNESAEEQGVE